MALYDKQSTTVKKPAQVNAGVQANIQDQVATIPGVVNPPELKPQDMDYMPGEGLIDPRKPPETIDQVVEEQKRTYAQKASDIQAGSYLEAAENYENLFGKQAPWRTREEYLDWYKNQDQEDIDYLKQQQDYSRQIEKMEFNKSKQQAEGSIAGVTAGMAEGREGPQTSGAPMFTQEYRKEVDRVNQMMDISRAAKEAERDRALAKLQVAQESGQMDLAQSIQGQIDKIESQLETQDIQARDFALREAATQQEMALAKAQFENNVSNDRQANYRANLTTFGSLIEAGTELDTNQLVSFSKSLNMPLEEVIGFYEGAQAIREAKGMDIQEQQLALGELSRQMNLAAQGYENQTARMAKTFSDKIKTGQMTADEVGEIYRIMNWDSSYNPTAQIKNRIDTANAVIKEYEAKYLGKPPPEGSIERIDYDIKKLELQKAYAEESQYSGNVPETTIQDIFFQKGTNRSARSKVGGDNIRECGEGYNDITDGPKVGDSFADKLSKAQKKSNPQIGNGLVTSHGGTVNGHIGTTIEYNPVTNNIKTVEWNHNGDGKQTIETYTIDELNQRYGDNWGFTDSKLKPEYAKKLEEANQTTTANTEVSKKTKEYMDLGVSSKLAKEQAEKDVLVEMQANKTTKDYKLTESQSNAYMAILSAKQVETDLERLANVSDLQGLNDWVAQQANAETLIGLEVRKKLSQEERMYIDMMETWAEAVLRKKSGAAISVAEYNKYKSMYFPQPGDTTEEKNRKNRARVAAEKGLFRAAGNKAQEWLDEDMAVIEAMPGGSAEEGPGVVDDILTEYGITLEPSNSGSTDILSEYGIQ